MPSPNPAQQPLPLHPGADPGSPTQTSGPAPGRPPSPAPAAGSPAPPPSPAAPPNTPEEPRPPHPAEAFPAPTGGPDLPRLQQPVKGRRLAKKGDPPPPPLTPEQRLLLLDTWRRSGLPARDFAPLVGVSRHTLYAWKKKFEADGPAGLMDRPRGGPEGSRLPDLTRRAILMLKETNPDWGCQRINDVLLRGPALAASPAAVARVLHEAGYELEIGKGDATRFS
jgi:transposase